MCFLSDQVAAFALRVLPVSKSVFNLTITGLSGFFYFQSTCMLLLTVSQMFSFLLFCDKQSHIHCFAEESILQESEGMYLVAAHYCNSLWLWMQKPCMYSLSYALMQWVLESQHAYAVLLQVFPACFFRYLVYKQNIGLASIRQVPIDQRQCLHLAGSLCTSSCCACKLLIFFWISTQKITLWHIF